MIEALHLREAVVFLAAVGFIIPLVKHFRLSPVLGFLFNRPRRWSVWSGTIC
jgi:hypothetical protein